MTGPDVVAFVKFTASLVSTTFLFRFVFVLVVFDAMALGTSSSSMSGAAIALSVTTVVVDTERWADFCGDERFAFDLGVTAVVVEAMIPDGISSSSLVVAEKEEWYRLGWIRTIGL